MRGTQILLAADPQGRLCEGTIVGTPKPGIAVELVPYGAGANVEQGGRLKYRPCTRAKGTAGPIAILLEDELQGLSYNAAYVTGTRCRVYYPALGEEMNIRVSVPGTGTGSDVEIIGGALDLAGDGTGKFQAGGAASSPFEALENIADSTAAELLVFARFVTS